MKTSFKTTILLLGLIFFSLRPNAQTIAIVGYNGVTGDGYTILAGEDIPASTKFYFTDSEYNSSTNVFQSGEGVWSYTTPSPGGLTKGDVVTFTETGTSTNVLTLDCNSPPCGSFLNDSGNSISLANTSAEGLYVYSDTDANHTNGITTIYAAFYNSGNFPGGEDPKGDFSNAIVVDGFSTQGDHRDFMDGLRPGTVTVADIENPANYDQSLGNVSLSTVVFANPVLPVELAAFNVRKRNDKTEILWTTLSETNNDYFEIERSKDGIHFESIGKIVGNGNIAITSQYSFLDETPLAGTNYYRLKQVDYDGAFEHSKIESVDFQKITDLVSVYPNPFEQKINILLPKAKNNKSNQTIYKIEIYDFLGDLVQHFEMNSKNENIAFDLFQLPSGTYFISIFDDFEIYHNQRIIKM